MILFHGSKEIVRFPEVRRAVFNKDFYFGFYCTFLKNRQSDGQPDMEKGICKQL